MSATHVFTTLPYVLRMDFNSHELLFAFANAYVILYSIRADSQSKDVCLSPGGPGLKLVRSFPPALLGGSSVAATQAQFCTFSQNPINVQWDVEDALQKCLAS